MEWGPRPGWRPTHRRTAAAPPRAPWPHGASGAREHEPVDLRAEPQRAFPSGPSLADRPSGVLLYVNVVRLESPFGWSRFCYTRWRSSCELCEKDEPTEPPWVHRAAAACHGFCYTGPPPAAVIVMGEAFRCRGFVIHGRCRHRVTRGADLALPARKSAAASFVIHAGRRRASAEGRRGFVIHMRHRCHHAAPVSCSSWNRRSCSAGVRYPMDECRRCWL